MTTRSTAANIAAADAGAEAAGQTGSDQDGGKVPGTQNTASSGIRAPEELPGAVAGVARNWR
jgi:hypothetical protein